MFVGVIGSMRLTTTGIEALEESPGAESETNARPPSAEGQVGETTGTSSSDDPQEEVA
ncbi:MAG: hypothetical protein ACI9EZ_000521 [Halobacteriales archaeon]